MANNEPSLGSIVTTVAGRGVVRFKGPTEFSTGKWIGVELYEKNGKNDGSIEGVRYFNCEPGCGIFVRPAQIKSIHGTEQAPSSRPGHQRTPSTGAPLRTNSASGSSTRSASPAKPMPVPQAPLVRSVASRPPASPTKLSSPLTTRKTLITRPSLAQRDSGTAPSQGVFPSQRRTSSPLTAPPIQSPPTQSGLPSSPLIPSPSAPPPGHTPPTIPEPPAPAPAPVNDTELQELRAKVKVLEAKRDEDSRHIRELGTRLQSAEGHLASRPQLQQKLISLRDELVQARSALAEEQKLSKISEGRAQNYQEQMEMAVLDKLVAEEKAELAEAELEDLKEKVALLEAENEVFKAENDGIVDGPSKDSVAYIQLEKQNERLKEALIKLRDMTQETDQDQRRRISEMEKDVQEVEMLRSMYEESHGRLTSAEAQIESLTEQLDDALTLEVMLLQLTERNNELTEKIEEMRITIEDLESLKELSDELEENHLETEKQLHQDIEARDAEIRTQLQKIADLEYTCQDRETTIAQFRELVHQLTTELEQLQTQTKSAQHQSATAVSQSAAVMSMNIKLQSTMVKNQARIIDLESYKIEANLLKEQLEIINLYLPDFVEKDDQGHARPSDTEAISTYLSFQRLGLKTDLINNTISQIHNLPEALNNAEVSPLLPAVCEMRSSMSLVTTLCKRFACVIRNMDAEGFLGCAVFWEGLKYFEERMDLHIDLLRKDQFKEEKCFEDIEGLKSRLTALAESYFDQFDNDLVERQLGSAVAFDLDLDSFVASMVFLRSSVASILKEEDVVLDMGGYSIDQEVFEPLDQLLSQTKSVKNIAKKLVRRLADLSRDSATVKAHLHTQLKALNDLVVELNNIGIHFARATLPHLKDARATKCSFQLSVVLNLMKAVNTEAIKDLKPNAGIWEPAAEMMTRLVHGCGKLLPAALEPENVTKVVPRPAPWKARVEIIKTALSVNHEAERKIVSLHDEMQQYLRTIRLKDQTIQESNIRIEMMERRLDAGKKQGEEISDLQRELAQTKKQEKMFEEAMQVLEVENERLNKEFEVLKRESAAQENNNTGPQVNEPEHPAIEANLETWHLLERIEALRGTVRFLRLENAHLKGQDLLREIESLPTINVPSASRTVTGTSPLSRRAVPALDPSGHSDTSDSDSDELPPPPTLNSLATETRRLYKDVITFSTNPRVVDLSEITARRAEAQARAKESGTSTSTGVTKVWMPRKKMPAQKVLDRKEEAEKLSRRVHGLMAKASALADSL